MINAFRRFFQVIKRPLMVGLFALLILVGAGVGSYYLFNSPMFKQEASGTEDEGELTKVDWGGLQTEYAPDLSGATEEQLRWQVSDYLPESMKTETLLLNKVGDFGSLLVTSLVTDGEDFRNYLNRDFLSEKGYSVNEALYDSYMLSMKDAMRSETPDISLYSARFLDVNVVEAVFNFGSLRAADSGLEDSEAVYPANSLYSMRLTLWFSEDGAFNGFIPGRISDLPEDGEQYGFQR